MSHGSGHLPEVNTTPVPSSRTFSEGAWISWHLHDRCMTVFLRFGTTGSDRQLSVRTRGSRLGFGGSRGVGRNRGVWAET